MAILGPDGHPWRNGSGPRDRDDSNGTLVRDGEIDPRLGFAAVPQVITFPALLGNSFRAYLHGRHDEALRRSREDALAMRRDCRIMALMQERKYAVSKLKWHIEGHDEKNAREVELKDQITEAIRQVPYFRRRVVRPLLESIWYGRYGVQMVPRWGVAKGKRTLLIKRTIPLNGDKIGYTWDDVPYVLVNSSKAAHLPGARLINATLGRALLLEGPWRERFLIHQHDADDADYFEPEMADAIHGVGVRSRIFWMWWVRDEWLEWVATYLERVGLGFTVWEYDASNPQAKAETERAAKAGGRRTHVLVPVWGDGRGLKKGGVERIDPPVSGVESLRSLIDYADDAIERYIVGQSMSGGNDEGDGLGGTGRADFARDTKGALTEDDAVNLAETLTGSDEAPGLVRWIQTQSRPDMRDVPLRFVFDVEQPESKEALDSGKALFDMGVPLRTDELRAKGGFSKPTTDDEVTKKPDEQAGAGGPDPAQEAQAQQQELAHSQAKHEQDQRHAEEEHRLGMERDKRQAAFDAEQAQRDAAFQAAQAQQKHALAMQEGQRKAALAAQTAQVRAAQQQQAWQQRQAQQGQMRQAAAYLRGAGQGDLADAIHYAAEGWDESSHPRDPEGKFAHKGEGSPVKGQRGVWKRLADAGHALGRSARRLKASVMRSLEPRQRKKVKQVLAVAHAVEHKALAVFHGARHLAREVAKERGADDEAADRLAAGLGAADLTLGWTTNFAVVTAATGNPLAGKVSAWVPVASMAYLAYSGVVSTRGLLVRNPFRTIRAARDLVRRVRERMAGGEGGKAKPSVLGAVADVLGVPPEERDRTNREMYPLLNRRRGVPWRYEAPGAWDESKHPRATDGRFGTKAGEHGGGGENAPAGATGGAPTSASAAVPPATPGAPAGQQQPRHQGFASILDSQTVRDLLDGKRKDSLLYHTLGKEEDTFLSDLCREVGYGEKPALVDAAEMAACRQQGCWMAYRGVTDPQFAEQFKQGDLWQGSGISGNGTYTVYEGLRSMLGRNPAGEARAYAGAGGAVFHMALPPDARVTTTAELAKVRKAEQVEINRRVSAGEITYEQADTLSRIIADEGRLAVLKGYHGIKVKASGYLVVLDRSSLKVQRENV